MNLMPIPSARKTPDRSFTTRSKRHSRRLLGTEKKQYAGRYEALLYEKNGKRQNDEDLITYISRKKTLFRNMGKVDKELPDNFKGYCLLRDARLTEKQAEMIHQWTKGKMFFETAE